MSDRRDALLAVARKRVCIDLFAGCGGLALGLHQAGWRGMFAVERDPMAFDTLQCNMIAPGCPYPGFTVWPGWLPKQPWDIEHLIREPRMRRRLASLKGKVSMIAGGPPCQGFSVGGIRDGRDSRNLLVYRLLDFVGMVKPPLVLIENVEGIARRFTSKPGMTRVPVADHIVNLLAERGYDAFHTIVDASLFGVPQIRRRVLILGIDQQLTQGKSLALHFDEALKVVRSVMLRELGLAMNRPISAYEAIHDLAGKDRVPCPDSLKFEAGTYTTAKTKYAKLLRGDAKDGTVPDSHRFSKHGSRILRMYRLAHSTQPPGRLSKEFLRSLGTKKDKKVRVDPLTPASTITTHPDEFIHYADPRNITVREMARLQSFPDDFHFKGRYTINGPRRRHDMARCSQVGNAVPPLLARAVGMAIIELIETAAGRGKLLVSRPRAKGYQVDLFEVQSAAPGR